MGKTIGIDLGSTNSCMAVWGENGPVILPNAEGEKNTPSAVAFAKTGELMVGQIAKRQALINPQRSFTAIKQSLGSGWQSAVDGRRYKPQELSAIILRKLKTDAEAYLGEEVSSAAIAVPASFTEEQRQAVREAGRLAGLRVQSLPEEPAAAALACALGQRESETVLVYDMGGAALDVTVLRIHKNDIRILAAGSNRRLGGGDFDQCIVSWLLERFRREHQLDLSRDPAAMQRIQEAAEKAKIDLSGALAATISLPYITAAKNEPLHLDDTLTRSQFSELSSHLVEASMGLVRQALQDAGMDISQISRLLLIGGCAHIPAVREALRRFTGMEPLWNADPDGCIAAGAAMMQKSYGPSDVSLSLLRSFPVPAGLQA